MSLPDCGAGGRDTAPQLVERLRARLGEEAVYGVASIPEHRPEAAWRRVHELSLASVRRVSEKMTDQSPGDGMPRPVWLLDAPLPLPDDLILEQGPERIESGWWDGRGVARDYYVARQHSGARPAAGREAMGFSGASIQALVFARDVRLSGGRACRPIVYAELHTLSNFSFLRGASQPRGIGRPG